jgi:hypothetical protein
MIGGMISSTLLTLLVIPAIYALWRARQLPAQPSEASLSDESAKQTGAILPG